MSVLKINDKIKSHSGEILQIVKIDKKFYYLKNLKTKEVYRQTIDIFNKFNEFEVIKNEQKN
jgi:hypothetical protein